MAKVGYTLMTEQAGPKDLVRWAARAEDVGFDLLVSSDHYFPWLDEQGHAPNAWVTLGAVAQVTERAELMTYVTCPTMRYHPAVVAQQAATLAVLSGDRFTLGLGAGENLNEHVIGGGWPDADQRQEMLAEAVCIIRALLDGGYVNFKGTHFRVDAARIWDLPDRSVPVGVAVSGQQSCETTSISHCPFLAFTCTSYSSPGPACLMTLAQASLSAKAMSARVSGVTPRVCRQPSRTWRLTGTLAASRGRCSTTLTSTSFHLRPGIGSIGRPSACRRAT